MFLKVIENFDKYLFLKINTQWTNGFLDAVMPWWRDQNTWIPLYLFLLVFAIVNFGNRTWLWLLFVIITISISDQLNSSILKYEFNRLRPCNDPVMQYLEILRLPSRSGSPSFPSSHACNHFAVGLYFFMTLKKYIGRWAWLFIFWAVTISYGQVYVGVHYPLDILAGAIEGTLIGLGVYYAYYKTNNALSNRLKTGEHGAFIGI
jgi:undecaprenyl-diphosphatase